jgi:hypothetical protein
LAVALLEQPGTKDPLGNVYRNQWTAAPARAFGTASHFSNMDNEMDIGGGTHRHVHPNPSVYDELRDIYSRSQSPQRLGLQGASLRPLSAAGGFTAMAPTTMIKPPTRVWILCLGG